MINIRDLATAAGVAAMGLATAMPAFAQNACEGFPSEPVIIQVPFAPGGGADRTFRLFAPYLSQELGVPVQVTNVAGGGGWVSWSEVANEWNDDNADHKLAVVNLPHVFSFLNPDMQRSETLDSFNFLAWHSYDPGLWLVRWDDDRFQTLEDVIEYAKEEPLIVAPGNHGGDDHVGLAFAEKAVPEMKMKYIFSDGGDNEKIQLLLSNTADMVAGNVGYYVNGIMERKMRPIAVLHNEPWIILPSVPTFQEITGKKNITYAGRTLAAANGLADCKREIYLAAIEKAMNNPEYVQKENASRNFLLYMTGDNMWQALRDGQAVAEEARYWEETQ